MLVHGRRIKVKWSVMPALRFIATCSVGHYWILDSLFRVDWLKEGVQRAQASEDG